ncbi:MAG: radical SAM family heme chaperone HemW [Chitinophagaceae bacterium]|nr:radical SAM family heme chaperone HemW [Chitinophagaceae bacterium]
MAGIYIHIPFCKQACSYCNFHFSTSLKLKNGFLDALLKEVDLRKDYLENANVETVYFGGGTPSLLDAGEVARVMETLNAAVNISADAEITFESNPDDITTARLSSWKQNGINRLSIGIQSFFKADLEWMNRAHNETQALDCIGLAHEAGFHNLSIDLIYGTPTLPDENWLKNLEKATSLNIPHLSCYALTVETGTALAAMIKKHKTPQVNSDDQARQFLLMADYLEAKGYEHYEISNFALPGMRSRHNSSYWSGAKYIGLGPSAHSFNGTSRQWNIANNALYIDALKNNRVPFEQEILSGNQRLNEYIMTSLRTMEGTDIKKTNQVFGRAASENLVKHSKKFIERGWMQQLSDRLVLTREGKLFADGIASELFELA